MTTDLLIARAAKLRPIAEIARLAGIDETHLDTYGRFKAKLAASLDATLPDRQGALVLVCGISPTPAGEGKTTTTIGLADALRAAGAHALCCLREPSLGPCFGVKGGATGGGRAQVAPMEDINLHFTGDFHAITAANNLLAAMIDNHIFWGNALGFDTRRISWRRCLDVNDRALRQVIEGVGAGANGAAREDGFDITVASEVMAIFCLARDLADLEARLARIIVATRRDGSAITAADLKAEGAMAVLLREAFRPNLVQTLEGTPALIHGGPFANIAHGCNSVMATRIALRLADVVVTEAGFGADLGGEKFLDIKCPSAGLSPRAAVIVATVRALKMHGGVPKTALAQPDVEAVRRGAPNLLRHVENMRRFGLPVVVALNHFAGDSEADIAAVREALPPDTQLVLCRHWAQGAAGAADLAASVLRLLSGPADYRPLYPPELPLADKIRTVAQKIYRAADVEIEPAAAKKLATWQAGGFGHLPVCMAKTQYSFSGDPKLLGAPTGFTLKVRDVKLSAGAGFVVALCGDILTMPGLPKVPAAERIKLDAEGNVEGLS